MPEVKIERIVSYSPSSDATVRSKLRAIAEQISGVNSSNIVDGEVLPTVVTGQIPLVDNPIATAGLENKLIDPNREMKGVYGSGNPEGMMLDTNRTFKPNKSVMSIWRERQQKKKEHEELEKAA